MGRPASAWFAGTGTRLGRRAELCGALVCAPPLARWRVALRIAKTCQAPPRKIIITSLSILLCLMFSKFVYTSSLSSFYTFYLIDTFGPSARGRRRSISSSISRPSRRARCWGPHRRQDRAQGGDLVLGAGGAALHAGAALCQSFLGRGAVDPDRLHPGVSLFRHAGLCAGAAAGPRRADFRHVLRRRIRHRARPAWPCWAGLRTSPPSASSSTSARSCLQSGCSPCSCPAPNRLRPTNPVDLFDMHGQI